MKKCTYCLLALLAACGGDGNRPPPCEVDECFSTDPDWTSFNMLVDNNDFGFQLSDLAGGEVGEAGGFFAEPNDVPVWYGDVDIGPFGGNDALSASGILNIVAVDMDYNNNVFIGHFDAGGFSPLVMNGIGIMLLESAAQIGSSEFRVAYTIGTSEGLLFTIDGLDQSRTWSYDYDPNAGTSGSLTISVSGPGGATVTHFLSAFQRDSIGSLQTFGFAEKAHVPPGTMGQAEIYFDDLSYTGAPTAN